MALAMTGSRGLSSHARVALSPLSPLPSPLSLSSTATPPQCPTPSAGPPTRCSSSSGSPPSTARSSKTASPTAPLPPKDSARRIQTPASSTPSLRPSRMVCLRDSSNPSRSSRPSTKHGTKYSSSRACTSALNLYQGPRDRTGRKSSLQGVWHRRRGRLPRPRLWRFSRGRGMAFLASRASSPSHRLLHLV
jgi:hypothetical protein